MSNTNYYNLIKPELTDNIPDTIGIDLPSNFDIIDSVMNGNRVDLDIIRTAKTTTGTATALAVDTDGTFDLTRNGNILTVIPNVTNTGAMTINVDGQGAKAVKKFNVDTDSFVDTEAGDSKKNTPLPLTWDLANDFFVLAPKGGSNIKSIQKFSVTIPVGTTTSNQSISGIDLTKTVIRNVSFYPNNPNSAHRGVVKLSLTNSNTVTVTRQDATTYSLVVYFDVIEYKNLKSLQVLNFNFSALSSNQSISTIDQLKGQVFCTYDLASGSNAGLLLSSYISSGTQATFEHQNTALTNVTAYVIEEN